MSIRDLEAAAGIAADQRAKLACRILLQRRTKCLISPHTVTRFLPSVASTVAGQRAAAFSETPPQP